MNRLPLFLLLSALCLTAGAQPDSAAVRHTHLIGIGGNNVLDTYLSPLEYTGVAATYVHQSERRLGRRSPSWTIQGNYSLDASYLDSPTDDAHEWDGNLGAGVVLLRNFRLTPRLRCAVGPMGEALVGFTYNTRNGNNPAQGRVAAHLGATGAAAYDFPLLRRTATVRLQIDLPLFGAQFSPQFGQSYYEIFSLGHSDGNVCLTSPFNAPSARWRATLDVPLGKTRLTLGYLGNIRQSHVNALKHHAWQHFFVIGYTRYVRLLP